MILWQKSFIWVKFRGKLTFRAHVLFSVKILHLSVEKKNFYARQLCKRVLAIVAAFVCPSL